MFKAKIIFNDFSTLTISKSYRSLKELSTDLDTILKDMSSKSYKVEIYHESK